MKNTLLIGMCLVGLVAFGQAKEQNKGKVKATTEEAKSQAQEKGKPAQAGKPENEGKPENVGKPDKAGKPEKPGKPENKEKEQKEKEQGNGNAYGRDKEGMTGREFGQQRAAEARAKHQEVKPTSIEEIQIERTVLRERNTTVVTEMDRKITEARERLLEMQKAGSITQQVYEEKISAIEKINERKLSVELKLK
jgi:colicin import membrane protein